MKRLLPLVFLLGCPPSQYRLGVRAADNGKYFEASQLWLGALEDDIYADRPRTALDQHAETAYNQQLDLAREHEANKEFEASKGVYESLFAFELDLEDVELMTFRTADTRTEYTVLMQSWADSEFGLATMQDKQGHWGDAMVHFEKVRELQPDYPLLDLKQGFSFLLWAEDDLYRGRYVDASTHYRKSFALTGFPETDAWGDAVDTAIGRWALQNMNCREANERFEAASPVPSDPALPDDLAKAADCSRIAVVVTAQTEEGALPAEHAALASTLLDRVERVIDKESSRYVTLYAADVLEGAEGAPETQYRVEVRMTQVAVEPEKTSQTKEKAEGSWGIACDKQTLMYEPDAICTEPAEVEYLVNRTAQVIRMSGSVKSVDLKTGEQSTQPLSIAVTTDTRHASDFQVYIEESWVPVEVAAEAESGRVGVPDEVLALNRAPQPLPPPSETLAQAVDLLAREAGAAVLATVDTETPLPALPKLEVRPPKMLPEDFTFVPVGAPEDPLLMEVERLPEDQVRDLNTAARTALASGDLEAAFHASDQARALDPENPDVVSLRGLVVAKLGMAKLGEELTRRVVKAHPKNARAWADHGLVLGLQKKADEAKTAMDKAKELGMPDAELTAALEDLNSKE